MYQHSRADSCSILEDSREIEVRDVNAIILHKARMKDASLENLRNFLKSPQEDLERSIKLCWSASNFFTI